MKLILFFIIIPTLYGFCPKKFFNKMSHYVNISNVNSFNLNIELNSELRKLVNSSNYTNFVSIIFYNKNYGRVINKKIFDRNTLEVRDLRRYCNSNLESYRNKKSSNTTDICNYYKSDVILTTLYEDRSFCYIYISLIFDKGKGNINRLGIIFNEIDSEKNANIKLKLEKEKIEFDLEINNITDTILQDTNNTTDLNPIIKSKLDLEINNITDTILQDTNNTTDLNPIIKLKLDLGSKIIITNTLIIIILLFIVFYLFFKDKKISYDNIYHRFV